MGIESSLQASARPVNEIWRITKFVEGRRLGFAVARIIMMSGVCVRDYERDTPPNDDDTVRVKEAARAVLSAEDLEALSQYDPDSD